MTKTSISELSTPVHVPEERTGNNSNEEHLIGVHEIETEETVSDLPNGDPRPSKLK